MTEQDYAEGSRPAKKAKNKGGDWDWDGSAWWEERSLAEKILMGIGFGILGLGLLAGFGWVTMALWNWLMPDIFGLKAITYWQAWGLLALSTILFQGFGSGGSGGGGRNDRKRKRQLRKYIRSEAELSPAAPDAPEAREEKVPQ